MLTRLTIAVCSVVLGVAGCDSSSAPTSGENQEDSFQDNDLPMGECEGTGGAPCPGADGSAGAAGAPVGGPCDGAPQCQSGVCAAAAEATGFGAQQCQSSCIGPMDEDLWCSDSAACCDGATCSPRGYCVPGPATPPADGTSGEESGGSGSTSTGGSGTSAGAQ